MMSVPDDSEPPEVHRDGMDAPSLEVSVAASDLDDPPRLPPRSPMRRLLLRRLRGYQSQSWLVKRGLTIGRDVYLGEVYFDYGFLPLISIGDETVLTDGVRLVAHDASTKLWVGASRVGRIDIGKRVYIGVGAIVLPGVSIGDEAIVGAGSVIANDVPPRTVVAGNPARHIMTLQEFVARHRAQLLKRPTYPRDGFVGPEELPAANVERMRRDLREGDGYVK